MNIYSNSKFFSYKGENEDMKTINDCFHKAFMDGWIKYLKPVIHQGKVLPVTMIRKNFYETIENYRTNPIVLNLDVNPEKLIEVMFGRHGFMALANAGGAYSAPFASVVNSGLFSQLSELQVIDEENGVNYDIGIIILIDDDLDTCGVNIDALLHHEYWHAMKQDDGMLDHMISKIHTLKDLRDQSFKLMLNYEEEREADKFALQETGERIHLCRIFSKYRPKHGISRLTSIFYGILTMIIERRNWF